MTDNTAPQGVQGWDVYLRVVSDDTLAFNIVTSWYCFSGPQINDERKFFEFESYENPLCISALKKQAKVHGTSLMRIVTPVKFIH